MKIEFAHDTKDFSTNIQGKQPCLMRSAVNQGSFGWRYVNQMISHSDVTTRDFKLMDGGIVPKQEYVETYVQVGTIKQRLLKPVVYERMRNGATLVMDKITGQPKVAALERQIACYTGGHETLTSAYATFGDKVSFRAHWDTRDLFAIQLIGRKRWVIHRPSLEAPLYMQQSKDVEHDHPKPEEPFMDFVLEPGDVFYLPRGWWHDPRPLGGPSFHLTVGVYPPLVFDYLHWACQQMPAFVEARQYLSTWEQDHEMLGALGRVFADFIRDEKSHRAFIETSGGQQRVESPYAIELFGDQQSEGIGERDGIALNALRLHEFGSGGALIANGVKLNLEGTSRSLITHIAEHPGVSLFDLSQQFPSMDAEKLRRLIGDLCRQDVLAVYPTSTEAGRERTVA